MNEQSNLLITKDDMNDEMLLSQLTLESQYKSQESLNQKKKKINLPLQNHVIQEENSALFIKDEQQFLNGTLNKDQKELQLLKLATFLKCQLEQQQQDFYYKELEFQSKLLNVQQKHNGIIELMKTKYQMIIEDLQIKLQQKTLEIENLHNQLQQQQDISLNQATQRIMQNKFQSKDSQNCTSGFFQEGIQNESQEDDNLINLYRQEIQRIKQQTIEFEKKFQNEKHTIKKEISTLKNQKQFLKTLINNKGIQFSDSKCKTKRENSQRAHSNISKKSFEF